MSDPLADRLSRLTPDAAGLNTGALLFVAGRLSVRSPRRWQALAGLLALSQLATLTLLLWPRHAPQKSTPASSLPAYTAPAPSGEGPPGRQSFDPDAEIASDTLTNPIPPDPPLRAFATSAELSIH